VIRRPVLPPWLRRGVEAGVVGAILSVGTLVAFQLSRPAPRLVLPHGFDTSMILAPAVVALGILIVAYPTFLAATREEAILGIVVAFLVAADAFMAVSFLFGDDVYVHPLARSLPLGVVAAAAAVPVALVGTLAGQMTAPLGFGHSTGMRSAMAGAVVGLIAVIVVAYTI
jgi:hypothetical protein